MDKLPVDQRLHMNKLIIAINSIPSRFRGSVVLLALAKCQVDTITSTFKNCRSFSFGGWYFQRRRSYWYARRTIDGRRFNIYLGKSPTRSTIKSKLKNHPFDSSKPLRIISYD